MRCGLLGLAIAGLLMGAQPASAQVRKGGKPAVSPLFLNMQATGKPALIIAGSVDCIYCREMSQELASDPALQPLVNQMFVVKVDTASRDWPDLRQTFQFEESGIPAVFFVRADGKLLYSDAGKPRDLQGFLKKQLDQSGKLLDEKTMKALVRDARLAEQAQKRKDFAKLAPLVQDHHGTGSYAAAALLFDRLGEELVTEATRRIEAAEKQLSDRDAAFDGVLALQDLERDFGTYEAAKAPIAAALKGIEEHADRKPLLEQARLVAPARDAEQAKKWKAAAETYQRLVETAPDSPVGKYAAERLKVVGPRVR